jgi:hypothetical protein
VQEKEVKNKKEKEEVKLKYRFPMPTEEQTEREVFVQGLVNGLNNKVCIGVLRSAQLVSLSKTFMYSKGFEYSYS